MFKKMLLSACLTTLPVPLWAEALGTISASIDGNAKTWFLTEQDGESQSGWARIMPGSLTGSNFTLWGNPEATQLAATRDALLVGAVLMPGPGDVVAIPELKYLENGFSTYWTSIEDDPAELIFTRIEEQDDVLSIAGTFTARLYLGGSASETPDRSRMITVSGTLEAAISAD